MLYVKQLTAESGLNVSRVGGRMGRTIIIMTQDDIMASLITDEMVNRYL